MEAQRFQAFRAAYLRATERFDDGDIEGAWGAIPANFEYRPAPNFPGTSVLRGPEQIVDYFRSVRNALPDARGAPEEFIDSGHGPYLVRLRMSGAAPRTDKYGESDLFQVWEWDGSTPIRVREFTDRDQAFKAAGLDRE